MKKLIVAVMIVAFASVSAFAAQQETVKYENKKGTVTFTHADHGKRLGCEACHEGKPAKIEVNKKAAHGKTCKGCHKTMKQGPTKCKACHVK